MFKVGERVKWRTPLDADYSYGIITEVRKKYVVIEGIGLYKGTLADVHINDVEKLRKGGRGNGGRKKYNK